MKHYASLACCEGKSSFPSFTLAQDAQGRGGRVRRPYHCGFCNKWHLGRPLGRERRLHKRQIEEKDEEFMG